MNIFSLFEGSTFYGTAAAAAVDHTAAAVVAVFKVCIHTAVLLTAVLGTSKPVHTAAAAVK